MIVLWVVDTACLVFQAGSMKQFGCGSVSVPSFPRCCSGFAAEHRVAGNIYWRPQVLSRKCKQCHVYSSWSWTRICYVCFRLQFRVYRPGYVDFDNVLTILVVYQNTIPNIRATRRALRSGRSTSAATGRPDSGSERFRRDVGNKSPESATYCRLYKWTVDFRALNWSWIVAPHSFEAGYCAGRCPRDGRDLELANFTNHAFVRMVHRAWSLNTDDGRLPAPSCVGVRYSPLSILYRTDEKTFELRSVNEIVSNECGCLWQALGSLWKE